MAKIIAIDRKYFNLMLSVLFVCLIGIAGVTIWKTVNASANPTVAPEVKMLGVVVEPVSFTKDITYGSVTLKASQVIPAKTFDIVVTLQNTTGEKMTNIPVELEVTLVGGDETNKVKKLGNLPELEAGATAKVAFRQINALGDAAGTSATAGQHKIVLRIKPNAAGSVNQTTEANFYFNVDSTVKAPNN